MRSELSYNPCHVFQKFFTGPEGQRFISTLGKSIVERSCEELASPIQSTRRLQLARADDTQAFPELRTNEVLATITTRQRKISSLNSPASSKGSQKASVLIIRMCTDYQDALYSIHLA
jgi:hypothetical protein